MAYARTVKTAWGARAVQIVHSSPRGSRDIEHIGSAHDDVELPILKAVAQQRIQVGPQELDLGLDRSCTPARVGAALPITGSAMQHHGRSADDARPPRCQSRCRRRPSVPALPVNARSAQNRDDRKIALHRLATTPMVNTPIT